MTKKDKTKKCQEILYKYEAGQKVSDTNEFDFLISIFEGHTEWEEKKGIGIDYITTKITEYKNRCFEIHLIDGTYNDISYTHAIKNRSIRSQIKAACRTAIKHIISDFRKKNVVWGVTICPITKEILTPDNTHIDHYNLTFNDIYEKWIKNYDEKFLILLLNATDDNSEETKFTDNKIIEDFIQFHNNNTHLRVVSKKANLSTLKKANLIDEFWNS